MEEKIIEKEKVSFLIENKDALINNFSSINYMLFNLLISNDDLEKLSGDAEKKVMSGDSILSKVFGMIFDN